MAKTGIKTVDEYLEQQSAATQKALRSVRSAIRKALPKAEELISYKIPAYKLNGRMVIFFAGWKEHYSVYPAGDELAELKEELARYERSRGTIRFPLAEKVPVKLIAKIAKLRAIQVASRVRRAKP